MALRQAVSWWCYENSGIAPAELMRTIAEIGYTGLELLPPEYFQLAADHKLSIVTIGGHGPLEVGLNKPENLAEIESQLRERLALAQQWHIPNLIVFSGNRDGQDDASGQAKTIEGLRKLAPLAEDAGITLLLELLNSKVDHPDFMCDSTQWGVEVIQQTESPNVKLLYDIYHMQVMEGDIISTIRANHQYIGHYHTAGVPGRNEIDGSQELNYAAIMHAIKSTGYTGYIGQEFVPKGDPIAGLREAYRICNV
jgi:hydroxypyruvate isomerase